MRGSIAGMGMLVAACAAPPDAATEPPTEPVVDSAADTGLWDVRAAACAEATPRIQGGAGEEAFVPFASETDPIPMEMMYGPQGGWHLWGAVRAQGLEPPLLVDIQALRPEDGAEVAWGRTYVIPASVDDRCEADVVGVVVYIDLEGTLGLHPPDLVGQVLDVVVTVDDRAERRLVDEGPVVVADEDGL